MVQNVILVFFRRRLSQRPAVEELERRNILKREYFFFLKYFICACWDQWLHFQNVLFLNRQINSLGLFSLPKSFNFSQRLAILGQKRIAQTQAFKEFSFWLHCSWCPWGEYNLSVTVPWELEWHFSRHGFSRQVLGIQWKGGASLQGCDSPQVHLLVSLEIFPKPSEGSVWEIRIIRGTVPGLLPQHCHTQHLSNSHGKTCNSFPKCFQGIQQVMNVISFLKTAELGEGGRQLWNCLHYGSQKGESICYLVSLCWKTKPRMTWTVISH